VVVGVDGSAESEAAAAVAAEEAEWRRTTLRLVHAFNWPAPFTLLGLSQAEAQAFDAPLEAASAMLTAVADRVRGEHPGLDVRSEVVAGPAAATLIDESARAAVVVVAARGHGGFAGLLLGSVSAQVSAHAKGPAIVVRRGVGRPATGPVMVGVDGTPESTAALRFAVAEADGRAVPLIAVWAWWMLPWSNLGPISLRHYDEADAADEARRLLAEAVAGACADYPDVTVEQRATHDINPAQALVDASHEAGLLVVGRHDGTAVGRWLAGSVGEALVRHAACPVAVVPHA
jgi:nucleotide-binding universal stress UspA family protein